MAQSAIAELANMVTGQASIGLERNGYPTDMSPPVLLIGAGSQVATFNLTRLVIPLVVSAGETGTMAYPSLTSNLHHEIELVAAIGTGGKNIKAADAKKHIYGYAVGLDMTRRDLQGEMKKQGRPWDIGKGFEQSAPIGPIVPAAQAGDVEHAEVWLQVNGKDRQRSDLSKLIWNIGEIIEHLSGAWELQPGDLVFTGTPEGVAAVVPGDTLVGGVAGVGELRVRIA